MLGHVAQHQTNTVATPAGVGGVPGGSRAEIRIAPAGPPGRLLRQSRCTTSMVLVMSLWRMMMHPLWWAVGRLWLLFGIASHSPGRGLALTNCGNSTRKQGIICGSGCRFTGKNNIWEGIILFTCRLNWARKSTWLWWHVKTSDIRFWKLCRLPTILILLRVHGKDIRNLFSYPNNDPHIHNASED